MVRAGRGGRFYEEFRDRSIAAIGWAEIGDLGRLATREAVEREVRKAYPAYRDQMVVMATSQLYRFAQEFSEGDRVVTYDSGARKYLCGEIVGPYTFHPDEENEEFLNQRKARWTHETARDALSSAARNSLGAISTIFRIAPAVSAELWSESSPERDHDPIADEHRGAEGALPIAQTTDEDIAGLSAEAIKDRIAQLDWQDMQDLVAGLLRAMGYKTKVSPPGADRGKDIVASPDGFGFQEPRIVVEVKHRLKERMGAQQVRSFLGGRHADDRGLYVSTGGFSKDAYYEAERSTIPLTLMDFEGLVEAILEHYSAFDEETKQILPLRRFYWPIDK